MNLWHALIEKISKKDMIYGFIIFDLIIVVITVMSWKFDTARELIDQITFGSALTTIMLAVVAMIYSYIQAFEASTHNTLVRQALNQISDKVEEFGKMKDELITLRHDTKTYNEHILESLNRFVEEASTHVDSIFEVLRERGLDVPEEVEKDISLAYRDKFNNELSDIRSRFLLDKEKRLIRELIALIQNSFQSGYEVTLLEIVDLLVYKGVEFEGTDLIDSLSALERSGLVRLTDTQRGKAIQIM